MNKMHSRLYSCIFFISGCASILAGDHDDKLALAMNSIKIIQEQNKMILEALQLVTANCEDQQKLLARQANQIHELQESATANEIAFAAHNQRCDVAIANVIDYHLSATKKRRSSF